MLDSQFIEAAHAAQLDGTDEEVDAAFRDLTYSFQDQPEVVALVNDVAKQRLRKTDLIPRNLLEVGCGTGLCLEHFQMHGWEVTGIEGKAELHHLAQSRLPGVEIVYDNPLHFELRQRFDIVVSLNATLASLDSQEQLYRAVRRMAERTKTNGVMVIMPWKPSKLFRGPIADAANGPSACIARVSEAKLAADGQHTTLRHVCTTGTYDPVRDIGTIRQFEITEILLDWEIQVYRAAMEAAGVRDIKEVKTPHPRNKTILVGRQHEALKSSD